ncbi:MAG: hypothetical protein IJ769_02625 [Clostridia bacterium]|nr:hypothetical protein [Clostridia bacterium]
MSDTQKIILIALLALGALCVIVGITLSHYIGGFIQHVEKEAQEEAEAEDARRRASEAVLQSARQEDNDKVDRQEHI